MTYVFTKSTLAFVLFTGALLLLFFTYVLTVDSYQNHQYKKESFVHYENFPSDNISARPVDIWLPEGYSDDPDINYPVIYLHDGQMMFNKETSPHSSIWYRPLDWWWGGIFWDVDASITELVSQKKSNPPFLYPFGLPTAKEASSSYQKNRLQRHRHT